MSNFFKKTKRAWEENEYDEIHAKRKEYPMSPQECFFQTEPMSLEWIDLYRGTIKLQKGDVVLTSGAGLFGKIIRWGTNGIVNHSGNSNGGHYISYTKNIMSEDWYEFNDSNVRQIMNPESIVNSGAYLLFYEKII